MNNNIFNKIVEISKALAPKYLSIQKSFHTTFIIDRNRIISIGVNNPHKTTPKNKIFHYRFYDEMGVHSEMKAILRLGTDDCSDFNFINIRINRNGQMDFSKPCNGCTTLLKSVGYKNFYYTTKDGRFEKL